MSFDEISAILKSKDSTKREEWEKLRMQCFYSVAAQTDIKKPTDLFKLPWDNQEKKQVSRLTKEQTQHKAQKVKKWLNGMSV